MNRIKTLMVLALLTALVFWIGQVRYKGHPGAVLHQGMAVMAHNSAVVVRIRQQQISKRAQKFRRLLGLKPPKLNKINYSKN